MGQGGLGLVDVRGLAAPDIQCRLLQRAGVGERQLPGRAAAVEPEMNVFSPKRNTPMTLITKKSCE